MADTTSMSMSSLTDLQKTDYVAEGLPVAKPKLIYAQYAQKDRVAKRAGGTRQWFRMSKLGLTTREGDFSSTSYQYVKNTTGLSPTWTPATAADTTVTATADWLFGQGHQWNDAIQYNSFADLPAELRKLNFMQAGEAIDTEVRDVIVAGSNVVYANGRATRPAILSTDTVDMNDFFTASTTLRNSDAPEISGMYSAMCSANVIQALMQDTTFQAAIANQKPYIFTGTIAELYGIRFNWTSRAATTSNGGSASQIATIEQTIITGDNAYGKTAWMLDDFDIVYTGPGGWGDEWATKHAITWKYVMKAVILNQSWMVRLESARA
jgi:N4-gp56 family major capsid protein